MPEHSEEIVQRLRDPRMSRIGYLALAEEAANEIERLREALRDLADAYRGIALNHPTVVTRHLPLIVAEEVLSGGGLRWLSTLRIKARLSGSLEERDESI